VEETFLQALHAEPNDETTWLALADWLEDDGQAQRAELVRLVRKLRTLPVMKRTKERARLEDRVAELLNAGMQPAVPEVVNSIGMRLALIPPGNFRMGSPVNEAERSEDEGPAHEVAITQPFYMGVFAVTQAQWQAVMGSNPSYFSKDGKGNEGVEYDLANPAGGKDKVKGLDTSDFPVENVNWEETQAYLEELTALPQERDKGWHYRLPTEAEWEYSCRGGASSSTASHFGHSLSPAQANFNGVLPYGGAAKGPFLGRPCPVGSYRPNAFGLYDTHGNVFEWCSDWYDEDYYKDSPRRDPPGPSRGCGRVLRGGSWNFLRLRCRAANRRWSEPADRYYERGFRVVAVPHG
jgi:uncharacterized protein (TIGR02996 family)